MKISHPLAPVFDSDSSVLILGTMPSPKSREAGFYYMHPQNKFWRILCALLDEPLPQTNGERRALLLRRHIALWDVLAGCEIDGADDGSIRKPVANDLSVVLEQAAIKAVFTTGTKAAQLYKRLCLPKTGITAVPLPSTSPANCRFYSYDDICEKYSVLLAFLTE
ncbi:MAG: DNA-deoxyinosine glycosylase [Clostridiales bacterium]|nr:DNA-deoxyinosine glycosylase [Clostridiales bacterium]